MRGRAWSSGWSLAALAALAVIVALAVPAQAGGPRVSFVATIDGHAVKDGTVNNPLPLKPADNAVVHVEVTNNGSSQVEVRAVRLDARVLGLAFFSYTTRVDLTVAPGQTGTRTFALDLSDLDGQATGLQPAEVALLAPDRTVLASEYGTVDVRGKLWSVYGVFGLAVAGITGLLIAALIFRLVRRSLPGNRWSRALRFALPGIGFGLTVTFTLSVLRVLVPSRGVTVGLLAGGLVVGLVLGYLTPNPGDEADRDELDDRDIVTVASQPVRGVGAPVTGGFGAERPAAPPAAPPVWAPAPADPTFDDPRQTRQVGPPPPPSP